MIRLSFFAAASALALAACSTTPEPVSDAPSSSSSSTTATDTAKPTLSGVDLAYKTADDLAKAGNVPAAIIRLMQLVGDKSITEEQQAETLLKLGTLSLGEGGHSAKNAIYYFNEIVTKHTGTKAYATAVPMLAQAKAKAASLQAIIDNASSTRGQKFDALFAIGLHDEAIDLMTQYNLAVGNEPLLAMYQIGYLCDDDSLTGKTYAVTDRDGTAKTLRFCDLGK
jgi:hypothetical protein